MANNQYVNKVQFVRNGTTETLIDLTGDTVTAANLAQGVTAHDASGAPITGTASAGGSLTVSFTFDSEADPPMWVPGKTFAQVKAAYDRGDVIVLSAPDSTEGVDSPARMYHYDEDVSSGMPETFYVEILWFDYEMVVTPEGSDGWEYDYYQLTSEGGWVFQDRSPLNYPKTLIEKAFTANGVYDPQGAAQGADGYSLVTVNVPKTTLQPLTVTPSAVQQVFNGSVQMGENELTYTALFQTTYNRGFALSVDLAIGTDYWLTLVRYSGMSGWADSQIEKTYGPVLWTATEEQSYPFSAEGVSWVKVNYDNAGNSSSSYRYMLHVYPVSGSTAYSPVTVEPIPSEYIIPTGTKSITENGTGIDVTAYASVDVSVPTGGTPSLQSKSVSYTPSETAQSATVTADSGYDGLSSVDVSVGAISSTYVGSGITQRSSTDLTASGATVTVPAGYYSAQASKAVASGTEGTPTATKGTVSNHAITVTPSVTNGAGYIEGGTKNGTAVTVSASELVSGTYSVTASGTHDVTNYASASVASGGATASATKGAVSNHSVTVTPSVTRTAGYVTAGTADGTAVTVSASELVSGSETKTANGTYDVTNLASLVVDIDFVTYHTSTSDPTSSQGSDGDIWLVTA